MKTTTKPKFICEIVQDEEFGTWVVGGRKYMPTWPRDTDNREDWQIRTIVNSGIECLERYYQERKKHPSYVGVQINDTGNIRVVIKD